MSQPSEPPLMGNYQRIACFGGIYSNYLALEVAIRDARQRGAERIFCLGDFGAFGPHPNRTLEILRNENILAIQGNYDNSISGALDDCQCGYTDPRDNYFAKISYDYTLSNTDPKHCGWMRSLPATMHLQLGPLRTLLCHGSPRKMNEFLWESTTPTHFLNHLADQYMADLILATHSGIKWERALGNNRHFVNVGVLGRPENDGRQNVWYTMLSYCQQRGLVVEFIPVHYDYQLLAVEMAAEGLPEEFIETVQTGWWTTCLEILPGKERRRGHY